MTEYEPDDDNGDVECPTCGRNDFKSKQGLKSHHAKAHGESIGGVPVDCDWCGRTKRVKHHEAEDYEQHFCGVGCKGEWQAAQPPEDQPRYNGGPKYVKCSWCGTRKEQKPCRAESQKLHFCDHECLGAWFSENRSGENSAHWKNATPITYGEDFTESKKKRIRERQNYRCAGCGMHQSDNWGALDVHHIQKARSFDADDEGQNDDSILVALCRPCHRQWEQMTPLRPQTPYLD